MSRLSFSTKQKVLQHSMIHTCSPDSLAAARCYVISIIAWVQIFMDLVGRSICLHIHGLVNLRIPMISLKILQFQQAAGNGELLDLWTFRKHFLPSTSTTEACG